MFGFLRSKLAALRITKKELVFASVIALTLYISSAMMFFGMNFWLWSFAKGLKRSYASIFVPSAAWALLFALSAILTCVFQYCQGIREPYFFWICQRGVSLLILIGLFDSLTGLCGMYAAVHVPVILQSALISTGPIWTFILSRLLYPESQPPFSPLLLLVVAFTVAGVTLAMVPQIQHPKEEQYFNPAWIFIYLIASASFPLYNVLQGLFLNEFKESCSPFRCKMIMLAVETVVQLVFTVMYFPVDAAPFFGKCDSIQESWEMFTKSLKCIETCKYNAVYMSLFIMGFWIRHIVFAYLNSYSPTVAAVSSQLTQPINLFILLILPSWNVYGAPTVWYYTLGCFLCLLASTTIFIWWHLYYKRNDNNNPSMDILVVEPVRDLDDSPDDRK